MNRVLIYKKRSCFFVSFQHGNVPVNLIWSRVRRRPYCRTARLPALKPSPYAGDVSDSIWCLKKSPSFISNWNLEPFFDVVDAEEDEVDATLLPDPEMIWESSHMCARTWQMPSSTSWLRERYPVRQSEDYLVKLIESKTEPMHMLWTTMWNDKGYFVLEISMP